MLVTRKSEIIVNKSDSVTDDVDEAPVRANYPGAADEII